MMFISGWKYNRMLTTKLIEIWKGCFKEARRGKSVLDLYFNDFLASAGRL